MCEPSPSNEVLLFQDQKVLARNKRTIQQYHGLRHFCLRSAPLLNLDKELHGYMHSPSLAGYWEK